MKLRYRILQSRWPRGGEWKNWGFFYETDASRGRALVDCHHNLDEKHWVVHDITQYTCDQSLKLEQIEVAVERHSDRYRVLDEVYTYEFEGPVSAAVNAVEAEILGLEHIRQDAPEEGMCIFSGRANRPLAQAVAHRLGLPLSAISITPLPDSELHVQVDEAVRQKNVIVVQPCSAPVNDHLVELLLMIDAFRRDSAANITAVIPYFPYARQERMSHGREAISARVVATMLETIGADRVIYVDIHAEATQGFFTVPVDRLQAFPILSDYFRDKPFLKDAVIVSPDVGRAKLAGRYAQALGLPLVVMHKRRESFREAKATHVVGDVEGKVPILIDDIIAGGSMLREIPVLFEHGAREEVYLAITHPVLLPSAMEMLDEDWIAEMVVTDTILVPPAKQHPKLKIVSVAPMLEYALRGIYHGTSISPLWDPDAPRKLGFTKS
jgi:ribose-phosphate pyrophosphokinase